MERSKVNARSIHRLAVGNFVMRLGQRPWFGQMFEETEQLFMSRLLIGLFVSYRHGYLPTKRDAMNYMQAVDGRTSQKYLSLAEQKKLIKIKTSKLDRRVDLICPTESCLSIVESELDKLAIEIDGVASTRIDDQIFVAMLEPMPETMADIERMIADFERGQAIAPDSNRDVARFTETIEIAPKNADAYRSRGQLYIRLGELALAIADLRAAQRINPLDITTCEWLAYAQILEKDMQGVIETYTKAIKARPDVSLFYEKRGQFLWSFGNNSRQAVSDVSNAIKYFPSDRHKGKLASLYSMRAFIFQSLGEAEKARKDFKVAEALADTQSDKRHYKNERRRLVRSAQ